MLSTVLLFSDYTRKAFFTQIHLFHAHISTGLLNNQNTSRGVKIHHAFILIILKIICAFKLAFDYILFLKDQHKAGILKC